MFLLLWLALGALSVAFAFTDGLAYTGIPSIRHVRELQSSGGDDDLCVEVGAAFAVVATIFGAARARRPFGAVDVAAHAALVALQATYLLLIEAGSIAETLARDRNGVLAGWLLAYAALAGGVALAATRGTGARADAEPTTPRG